jgi:hypothetical protein
MKRRGSMQNVKEINKRIWMKRIKNKKKKKREVCRPAVPKPINMPCLSAAFVNGER